MWHSTWPSSGSFVMRANLSNTPCRPGASYVNGMERMKKRFICSPVALSTIRTWRGVSTIVTGFSSMTMDPFGSASFNTSCRLPALDLAIADFSFFRASEFSITDFFTTSLPVAMVISRRSYTSVDPRYRASNALTSVRTSMRLVSFFVLRSTVSPAGRLASLTDAISLPRVANFSAWPSIAYIPDPVFWIFCWINSVLLSLIMRTYAPGVDTDSRTT
mmetsp:Transcript_15356/g.39559  ORF Transcript_15356/g.39559 Transcript_15356/m.39559 type:complete len:218 (+) Transcript_15356:1148-1801(+)